MIKAVIFDLDGTLVHMKLKVKEAKKALLEKLRKLGPINQITIEMPVNEMVEIASKLYGLSRKDLMRIVDESFQPYEIEAAERAELRENVKQILDALKRMGIKIGIASNNGVIGVSLALEKTSIKEFFDAIVTRNDADRMKPDGAIIAEAVKRLKVKPGEAAYVGDTAYDVIAARNAGVKAVSLVGGAHPTALLKKHKPDALIKDLRDLLDALKSISDKS